MAPLLKSRAFEFLVWPQPTRLWSVTNRAAPGSSATCSSLGIGWFTTAATLSDIRGWPKSCAASGCTSHCSPLMAALRREGCREISPVPRRRSWRKISAPGPLSPATSICLNSTRHLPTNSSPNVASWDSLAECFDAERGGTAAKRLSRTIDLLLARFPSESTRSCSRPGVATITCASFASWPAPSAARRRRPTRRCRSPAISANSSVTCTQSSRVGTSTSANGVPRVSALDDRDRERERLARAGRALREDVTAPECLRDDERLDLERGVDAARCEQFAHGLGNPEGTKVCHLSQLLRTSRSRVRWRRRDLTGARPIRVP